VGLPESSTSASLSALVNSVGTVLEVWKNNYAKLTSQASLANDDHRGLHGCVTFATKEQAQVLVHK
jgi:hypothetical protein